MAYASSVRPDTLRCAHCRQWKPDTAFHAHGYHAHRRHRAYQCRDCRAIAHQHKKEHAADAKRYTGPFVSIFAPWSKPLPTTPLEPGPLTRGDR